MHRQYQEVCRAQQEASARNKLLLEDVNRLQRRLSTPARSKLQQMKSRYEEEIVKLYPAWVEQVQQFKKQKEAASLSEASQQPNSSHTPFVALPTSNTIASATIATVVTNSNSSHVSDESTPPGPLSNADYNQSNQLHKSVVSQGHSSQHSDISLTSLSSVGSPDHKQDRAFVPSTEHITGNPLSASHDLSISHDDVSSEDDFWSDEAPPISTAAPPTTTLSPDVVTTATAPPTSTIVTAAPPISTVATLDPVVASTAPPTSTIVTTTPPIYSTNSTTNIPPTTATPTIPARTNIASLFIVTTTTTNVTSNSSVSITPISSVVISAASPVSSATPIMSAVNSSDAAATPITNAVVTHTIVTSPDSSGSATPITDATPPKLSSGNRPAATDSTNQNAAHQPSVAVLESSTSAGFQEHVPLTETAAYQSLARSLHHHDNSSSDISEGSAVLELEQLSTQSPGVVSSYRQEVSPLHSGGNTQGVKMTQDTITMDSDDESSVSLPSGGEVSYVPSTLEQHSRKRTTPMSHTIDLKKLGILGGSDDELDELPAAPTSETSQSNQLDEFDFYN